MILVDTSVWVDHLRGSERRLVSALEGGEVLIHPFVIGELACGNLINRAEVLALLADLPTSPVATDAEALAFIEAQSLMRRGIGYIDVHLLAATMLSAQTTLWTRDKRLARIADELQIGFTG